MVGIDVGGPLSHSVDYPDKKEGDYASFGIALFRSLKANFSELCLLFSVVDSE
jgi:hypothetical protein